MVEVGESSGGGAKKPEIRESRREKLLPYRAKKLAERTLEGKWDKVVGMYTEYPGAHTNRITEDNDNTALHVAVDLKKEQEVKEMVEAIIKFEKEQGVTGDEEALRVKNKNGDTPLHLAASRGFTKICMWIVGVNEERMHLLRLENEKGETPFFLSALNWNTHAFAYLFSVADKLLSCSDEYNDDDIRRLMTRGFDVDMQKRESILHCAIKRECFDLAFIIASNFSFLTIHSDNKGITPLHVLAERPSAFKSTTQLSFLKQLLYHFIPVDELDADEEMEKYKQEVQRELSDYSKETGEKKACSWLLGKLLRILPGQRDGYDEENASNCFGKRGPGFLPPNYDTILQFLKSIYMHSSLNRLADAYSEVRGTKQKHIWSSQLLEKLMENPFEAFTGNGGGEPRKNLGSDFEFDEDQFMDFPGWKESSPKQENTSQNPSDANTREASTHENDSKEGTKSGDLVLKCCDCVLSDMKNKEECERIKPMKPQLLMKCGCGRADCKSNIAAAIAVADHNTEYASDDSFKKETPYLLAAKHGIIEMVLKIQKDIPSVIHSTNSKNQNVLLVAVKNKQPKVVLGLKKESEKEVWRNLVIGIDDDENTLLHLAAEGLKGDWQIAGYALQMMWDIKWYQYMKKIVPRHCHFRNNRHSKTAAQIFNTSHQKLIEDASQWLKDTSESCSVVAALVAGVSFATAGNVPGGYDNGKPPLEGQTAFDVFALASLVGLCFSVTGLIMFLSILTSRKVAKDFRRSLPLKLLAGLSSLFVSIITMFISFCSGHFFLVDRKHRSILFPLYAATSIPVAFYALAQFPLYIDLLRAILTTVPMSSDVGEIL